MQNIYHIDVYISQHLVPWINLISLLWRYLWRFYQRKNIVTTIDYVYGIYKKCRLHKTCSNRWGTCTVKKIHYETDRYRKKCIKLFLSLYKEVWFYSLLFLCIFFRLKYFVAPIDFVHTHTPTLYIAILNIPTVWYKWC